MVTVVTGAAGFIGRALVRVMAERGPAGPVRLVDRERPDAPAPGFETLAADLTDSASLSRVLEGASRVIHLAALPGGASEADPAASRAVNLEVSLNLLELLSRAPDTPTGRPRLVYASSIAVFGAPMPARVDDDTPPAPHLTYGAHKQMVEIAVADAARRGRVQAIALRLPGVVARPPGPAGFKSGFMSEVFHRLTAGVAYTVPVSPEATMWLVSARAAAEALLHGLDLSEPPNPPRALTLPALRVGMAELVEAIASATGADPAAVAYDPDPALEAGFGRQPPLSTPAADGLGFRHDGSLPQLVTRALKDLGQ